MRRQHQASRQRARRRCRTIAADARRRSRPSRRRGSRRRVATQLVARDAPRPSAPLPRRTARRRPIAARRSPRRQPAAPSIAPDTPPHESAERLLAADRRRARAHRPCCRPRRCPTSRRQRADPAAQRWTFEVPFATPQGTGDRAVRGEPRRQRRQSPTARRATWRARFSLDVEPMGPVHALVALAGARTSVTLWAERHATAARLNEQCARC